MARYTLIAPEGATSSGSGESRNRLITCDVHTESRVRAEVGDAPLRAFEVTAGGSVTRATLLDTGPPLLFSIDGKPCEVVAESPGEYRVIGSEVRVRVATGASTRTSATATTPCLVAPMPGRIVRLLCQAGDLVEAGTPLVVLEAMKMENELVAPVRGRVEQVFIQEGSAVEARAKLVILAEP